MTSYTSHLPILVAVEPTLYRTGLMLLMHQEWPELEVIVTADRSQILHLTQSKSFQLLILDDQLMGSNISTLLHCLHQTRPTQKILRLTNYLSASSDTAKQFLLPRHTAPNHLITVLTSLLIGTSYRKTRPYAPPAIPTHFSARELEVLHLVVADYSNKEIANQLYLSVRTIESHRRALLQKSGTRTLVGLVAWVLRAGIIA